MSAVKSQKTLKQGLAYISERTGQLRYADKNGDVKWVNPQAEYIAATVIKRGQPVSIATAEQLAALDKKAGNNDLSGSSVSYIVPSDPTYHKKSCGLAMEYAEKGSAVHVCDIGSFTFRNSNSDKEYYPSFTYESDIGKVVYVSGTSDTISAGTLTTDKDAAFLGFDNIMIVGYVADAPAAVSKNSTDEAADIVIDVQMSGDDRGPINHTQFEATFGEKTSILASNPLKLYAFGCEEDKKFAFTLTYYPYAGISSMTAADFIAVQRMDGLTEFIRFDGSTDVPSSSDSEDSAFISLSGYYRNAFMSGAAAPVADVTLSYSSDKTSLDTDFDNIVSALSTALKDVADQDVSGSYKAIAGLEAQASTYGKLADGTYISECARLDADQYGGYYRIYVSKHLQSTVFPDLTVISGGSYSNKGLAVTADIRIPERQNIIGFYYSGKYSTKYNYGDKAIFMRNGKITVDTSAAGENYLTPGASYYLGYNGSITSMPTEYYDTVVKIGEAQTNSIFISNCDNARVTPNGDLPVGYMKPSVNGSAEYGFLLMDGGRYKVSDYPELEERLLGWFNPSVINAAKTDASGSASDELYFTVPSVTYPALSGAESRVAAQIKYMPDGVFHNIPRVPFMRAFGTFANDNDDDSKATPASIDSVDITSIALSGFQEKYNYGCDLDQLDIHLYVNLDDSSTSESLIHWTEIKEGFHVFNNLQMYGFKWSIKYDDATTENPRGKYTLSTDIGSTSGLDGTAVSGLGIAYQRYPLEPPATLAGHAYKVYVAKKEFWMRQFDAEGMLSSLVSQTVVGASGSPVTSKAPSGKAVSDYIASGVSTDNLTVAKSINFDSLTSLSGKVSGIAITGLNSTGLVIKKDGGDIYYKFSADNGRLSAVLNTADTTKTFADLNYDDGDLIPHLLLKNHIDEKITASNSVHGIKQGAGNNFDADMLDGIHAGTGTDANVKTLDTTNHRYYIPVVIQDTKNGNGVISVMNGIEYQIYASTGSTIVETDVIAKEDKALSRTKNIAGSTSYRETITNTAGTGSIIMQFNVPGGTIKNAAIGTVDASLSGSYDIVLSRAYSGDSTNTGDGFASVKVGNLGIASSAEYKYVSAERYNAMGETAAGKAPAIYSAENTKRETTAAAADDGLGSALQALYEVPVAVFKYRNDKSWYKEYLGIIVERINWVKNNIGNTDIQRVLFETGGNTSSYSADSKGNVIYTYDTDQQKSIASSLNRLTDNAGLAQNIISSVGLLLQAGHEAQERLLKLEASAFGADAGTIPGEHPQIDSDKNICSTPTYLGLNRIVRALCLETFGSADPLAVIGSGQVSTIDLSYIDVLRNYITGSTVNGKGTTEIDATAANYPALKGDSPDSAGDGLDCYTITAKKTGTATITAALTDGSTAAAGLTVYASEWSYTIAGTSTPVENTAAATITATSLGLRSETVLKVVSNNETAATVSIASDNTSITITPASAGSCTVAVTGSAGTSVSVDVTVKTLAYKYMDSSSAEKLCVSGAVQDVSAILKSIYPTVSYTGRISSLSSSDETVLKVAAASAPAAFTGIHNAINRIAYKLDRITTEIHGSASVQGSPARLNALRSNIDTILKELYLDKGTHSNVAGDEVFKDIDDESRIDKLTNALYSYSVPTLTKETNAELNYSNGTAPESIGEYGSKATALAVIIETLGDDWILRKSSDNYSGRNTKTFTERLANIESALDSITEYLSKAKTFENPSLDAGGFYAVQNLNAKLREWAGFTADSNGAWTADSLGSGETIDDAIKSQHETHAVISQLNRLNQQHTSYLNAVKSVLGTAVETDTKAYLGITLEFKQASSKTVSINVTLITGTVSTIKVTSLTEDKDSSGTYSGTYTVDGGTPVSFSGVKSINYLYSNTVLIVSSVKSDDSDCVTASCYSNNDSSLGAFATKYNISTDVEHLLELVYGFNSSGSFNTNDHRSKLSSPDCETPTSDSDNNNIISQLVRLLFTYPTDGITDWSYTVGSGTEMTVYGNTVKSFTATDLGFASDATISTAVSSNPAVATVSVDDAGITITPVAAGSCTVTITGSGGTSVSVAVAVSDTYDADKTVMCPVLKPLSADNHALYTSSGYDDSNGTKKSRLYHIEDEIRRLRYALGLSDNGKIAAQKFVFTDCDTITLKAAGSVTSGSTNVTVSYWNEEKSALDSKIIKVTLSSNDSSYADSTVTLNSAEAGYNISAKSLFSIDSNICIIQSVSFNSSDIAVSASNVDNIGSFCINGKSYNISTSANTSNVLDLISNISVSLTTKYKDLSTMYGSTASAADSAKTAKDNADSASVSAASASASAKTATSALSNIIQAGYDASCAKAMALIATYSAQSALTSSEKAGYQTAIITIDDGISNTGTLDSYKTYDGGGVIDTNFITTTIESSDTFTGYWDVTVCVYKGDATVASPTTRFTYTICNVKTKK